MASHDSDVTIAVEAGERERERVREGARKKDE